MWTSLRKMLWYIIINSSTVMDTEWTGAQKPCLSLSNIDVSRKVVFPPKINNVAGTIREKSVFQHLFFISQNQAKMRRTRGLYHLVEESTLQLGRISMWNLYSFPNQFSNSFNWRLQYLTSVEKNDSFCTRGECGMYESRKVKCFGHLEIIGYFSKRLFKWIWL